MTKIAVFVGSLQEKSHNLMLARAVESFMPDGFEFEYIDIRMPLFNQDLEAAVSEEVTRAKQKVEEADGVLFVTPEYNRSIPGVLKNAIDWISRPYGANSFAGKRVGTIGASTSVMGTIMAQSHLHHTLAYLDTRQLNQPEVYVANAGSIFNEGQLIDERWEKNLKVYVEAFVKWVTSEE